MRNAIIISALTLTLGCAAQDDAADAWPAVVTAMDGASGQWPATAARPQQLADAMAEFGLAVEPGREGAVGHITIRRTPTDEEDRATYRQGCLVVWVAEDATPEEAVGQILYFAGVPEEDGTMVPGAWGTWGNMLTEDQLEAYVRAQEDTLSRCPYVGQSCTLGACP